MSAFPFVFNVYFRDEPTEEPTLFERRKDAKQYAALFANAEVEEVTVMDQRLAAGFISEAEADIEAEQDSGGED